MKKIKLQILISFFCPLILFSQTLNIHKNDGSVNSFSINEIDSITFSTNSNVDGGILFKNFGVTDSLFLYDTDWDQFVQNIFGEEYRVADWNDLVNYYDSGESIEKLFNGLNLYETEPNTDTENSAFVTKDGARAYSSTRYYFVSRHDHNKPSYYTDHANIDNYLLSLGSWAATLRILVIKK